MTIGDFLTKTTAAFEQAGTTSARLDAQILLSDALKKDKSWLLANPEFTVPEGIAESVEPQIKARLNNMPLAYIRGKQEFYGREFTVNDNVLIPRPETEALIELVKKYVQGGTLLDVGTGSGAIAITLALEIPNLRVTASDVSQTAIAVAAANAKKLGAQIDFIKSDLLKDISGMFDAIVANLPYVSHSWEVSPETVAEPDLALYAEDDGLELIYKLIAETPAHIATEGYLVLEADPRQHSSIQKAANEHGWVFVAADDFGLCFRAS